MAGGLKREYLHHDVLLFLRAESISWSEQGYTPSAFFVVVCFFSPSSPAPSLLEDYVKAFSGLDMILISGEVIVVINKERAGHVLPERLIIVPEYCQVGTGHRPIVCLFVCLIVRFRHSCPLPYVTRQQKHYEYEVICGYSRGDPLCLIVCLLVLTLLSVITRSDQRKDL